MNTKQIDPASTEELTPYGAIGLSVFIIIAGLSYLLPSIFPEMTPYFPDGTNYIAAGVLIILVNMANGFKGLEYDWFLMLLGITSLVMGINKAFSLEVKFLPVLLIVLGLFALFKHLKRLRN